MRILFLNWKDVRHPAAGGAEYATHELAKGLINRGHNVKIYCSGYKNLKSHEYINSIEIFRRGNFLSVYIWAAVFYLFLIRKRIDIVIDQMHGIPFFTPLYVKKPILVWIHEVAGSIWPKEFGRLLLGPIGSTIEKLALKFYREKIFLTDSPSTKYELQTFNISPKNIHVIPLTINKPIIRNKVKTSFPTLIYLGRITPMKRIELLLTAASLLLLKFPNLRVLIAGYGKVKYIADLQKLTTRLNLKKQVKFLGQISENEKYELLRTSWLHIHPSLKEGFGLTVLEAASQKTPTVAFKVGSLKDIIKPGLNGYLVKEETPEALARTINILLSNKKRLNRLSQNAFNWYLSLPDWETQTKRLEKLLQSFFEKGKQIPVKNRQRKIL